MISGVSCVVLAGGESRRMGRDKAQVKLAGSSLLERVLKVVTPLFDDVMLSCHNSDKEQVDMKGDLLLSSHKKGVRVIEDQLPGRGPAIGLCTALGQARHAHVFVIACDMPFILSNLIEHLVSYRSDYDMVVPIREGRPEPLCAVYSKACLESLNERVRQDRRGLVSWIENAPGLKIRRIEEQELDRIDPALHSFIDIDSEHALKEAETILEGAGYG